MRKPIKQKIKVKPIKHTAYKFLVPSWLDKYSQIEINKYIVGLGFNRIKIYNDMDYYYKYQKMIASTFDLSLSVASYFLFDYIMFGSKDND